MYEAIIEDFARSTIDCDACGGSFRADDVVDNADIVDVERGRGWLDATVSWICPAPDCGEPQTSRVGYDADPSRT